LGVTFIGRAALLALSDKVNARLSSPGLDEDEEHDLVNDLAAIDSAGAEIALALPNLHLPHFWR
jgi:hypothetical protein